MLLKKTYVLSLKEKTFFFQIALKCLKSFTTNTSNMIVDNSGI